MAWCASVGAAILVVLAVDLRSRRSLGRRRDGLTASSLTRRDVLAAFLGAPLALGRVHARRSAYPTARWRSGPTSSDIACATSARPRYPRDKWERAGIVIVGAGDRRAVRGAAAPRRRATTTSSSSSSRARPGGTARERRERDERVPVGRALHHRADEGERRAARAPPRARSRRGHRRRGRADRSARRCSAASRRSACSPTARGTKGSTSTTARRRTRSSSSRASSETIERFAAHARREGPARVRRPARRAARDDAELTALDRIEHRRVARARALHVGAPALARRLRVPRRLRRARRADERVGGHPLLRVAPRSARGASRSRC